MKCPKCGQQLPSPAKRETGSEEPVREPQYWAEKHEELD